ncbi:MAG TPA: carboxypeptidase M32 [Candidatus Acidoferrales bacterium]|nr:carboxypeptidase M32 [Candidatus Acidoferrales bacterium]
MRDDRYSRLIATLRQHADLAGALRLLEWDQETFMPAGALDSRARQIGALAALLHERQTDPRFLDIVDELAADASACDAAQAVDVRETKWRLDRERRLDAGLVHERSILHAQARGAWIGARRDNDFPALAPSLARIVAMERRVAAAIDANRDPYGVLLEGYEPGTSVADIDPIFSTLRDGLLPLIDRLKACLARRPLDATALCGDFPLDAQRRFSRLVVERLGFDFGRGRLDEAAHPFTTTIGQDIRLTTRYDARDLRYALYSTLHEMGHGLYEQGLDLDAWGTPRGLACSLGIHESQSRLWENQVGRSAGFWRAILPLARELFPMLAHTTLEAILLAVNAARPSLIRTEADEITYNLHIILRFELERALIDGSLAVADLPAAWQTKMQHYLGVAPENDRDGVLQDVHWASGDIGYFPTYTLGNIYAAQLMAAAEGALGSSDLLLAAGEFGVLLGWLRAHVHRRGQTYRAPALIEAVTGEPPTPQPLLEHLQRRVAFLESA